MIVRLIVFIAIFVIAWWLYRQFVAFKVAKSSDPKKTTKQSKKAEPQENMVRCAECQTFTPKSHAVHDQEGRPFCSTEHLKVYHQKS